MSLIALMGAGCAGSAPAPAAPPTDTANQKPTQKMSMGQFMMGQWKFKSMQRVGGQPVDVSALNLIVSFDGGQMDGKVCNNMSGPYSVEDNLVKFGPVAMTKMFCEGLPGEVETAFTSGLQGSYTITKQDEDLMMQGAAVFVLGRE